MAFALTEPQVLLLWHRAVGPHFFRPLLTLKMLISLIAPIRAQGSPVKTPCVTCIHSPYGGKDRNRHAGTRGDRVSEAGAGRGLPLQTLRMLTGWCERKAL